MSKKNLSKKEQFTKPKKSNLPMIAVAVSVVLLAAAAFILLNGSGEEEGVYFGDPVADTRSYIGEQISMTVIEPVVENGEVRIPFNEIDENNIVYFEVENDESQLVPLMAYITPSGRLFAGSSMCEPCQGRTFTLAGETLVCDTCRTTYNLEDHQFLSGSPACGSYPPVNMNPQIEDGDLVIELEEVLKWRTRI